MLLLSIEQKRPVAYGKQLHYTYSHQSDVKVHNTSDGDIQTIGEVRQTHDGRTELYLHGDMLDKCTFPLTDIPQISWVDQIRSQVPVEELYEFHRADVKERQHLRWIYREAIPDVLAEEEDDPARILLGLVDVTEKGVSIANLPE